MKKLLLSSIIMFAVCSFAGAQKLVNNQDKKNSNVTGVAPQKSASAASAVTTNADGTVAESKAVTTETKAATKETKVTSADMNVGATDVRTDADKAKKMEAIRLAEKAAVKKGN